METKTKQIKKKRSVGVSAGIVILCCFIVAECIFHFWFGHSSHFEGGDPAGHPIQGDFFGIVYKGGFVVPLIMTLLLTVLALSVERFFAINKAQGNGSLVKFVESIKTLLEKGDIAGARAVCAKQKGCVGNIVDAALIKYAEVEADDLSSKDQKLVAIQKEVEEATALEMPVMQQNLPVIATISTLGTLMGLFGTVLGMVRSFSALGAAGGAPDSVALSNGISEALINTALGIATGALAIISYALFTGRIDKITYAIDEIGFTIVQTYAVKHQR